MADIVAKVAAALLWNSNLKETNRDVRTFESVLRVRVKTRINVTPSHGQNTFATLSVRNRRSMRADECLFLVEKRSCSGHHRKDQF
jgi:hypothetical protein